MKKNRTLKTRLLSLLLILAMLLTLAPSVFAVEVLAANPSEDLIEPQFDETAWVFKELYGDGIMYKRLWSYTQGKWLTDWEFAGYVEN